MEVELENIINKFIEKKAMESVLRPRKHDDVPITIEDARYEAAQYVLEWFLEKYFGMSQEEQPDSSTGSSLLSPEVNIAEIEAQMQKIREELHQQFSAKKPIQQPGRVEQEIR